MHMHSKGALCAFVGALCVQGAFADDRPIAVPWSGDRDARPSVAPSDPVAYLRHLLDPVPTGSVGGLNAGAQHVIDQQCMNGGWGWPHDDCGTTYNNITGPIAMGLISVYELSGYQAALDAAVAGGDYDIANVWADSGDVAFGSFAPAFFELLSAASGDTSYRTAAETDFFDKLTAGTYGDPAVDATYYPADTYDYQARHFALRAGYTVNLRPWDMQYMPWVAGLLGNADSTTPADAVSQQDAFLAHVIAGIESLNSSDPGAMPWDLSGLAGGVHALGLNGTTTFAALSVPDFPEINGLTTLCSLAAVLADFQNANGSWYWASGLATPDVTDEDTQGTAYALMALVSAAANGCPCSEEINAARDWLKTMQDVDGGYFSYPTGGHNTEVEGEVLKSFVDSGALLTLEIGDCPDDADAAPGNQIAIEVWMRDLTSPATGFQAFITYDTVDLSYRGDLSSYTSDPFPLHIQGISGAEVAAGEIRIDGSDSLGDPGESADSLLATLIFDVDIECDTGWSDFDLTQAFDSELSFEGSPVATNLVNTGLFNLDDTPPMLDPCPADITVASDVLDPCPADITVASDASVGDGCQGATVSYTVPGATDNCGAVMVECSPPSGSFFALGITEVTCTATDDCGNTSECTFDVEVTATNEVCVDVELVGVNVAVTRCIHFVTDDCGSTADASLMFTDHDGDDPNENGIVDTTEGTTDDPSTPVRAIATIEVPCGNWTALCAKDEAHTLWDTTGLTVVGAKYVADTLVSLEPGDTDNDGDVDINDVTLVILQFGGPEPSGGCPWDGTRGADFSNNGNVGSEDYSLLSGNWLEMSFCVCTTAAGSGRDRVEFSIPSNEFTPADARRLDINADGMVDFRDVRAFERRHGLPNTVSTSLLLKQQGWRDR